MTMSPGTGTGTPDSSTVSKPNRASKSKWWRRYQICSTNDYSKAPCPDPPSELKPVTHANATTVYTQPNGPAIISLRVSIEGNERYIPGTNVDRRRTDEPIVLELL